MTNLSLNDLKINSCEYEIMTNTWKGVKGAAFNAATEFCIEFGWIDYTGCVTIRGSNAIREYLKRTEKELPKIKTITYSEAADLILLASYSCSDHDSKTAARNSILATVAFVMDAARADAFEEVADFVAEFGPSDSIGNCESASSIRRRAKSHREPKL